MVRVLRPSTEGETGTVTPLRPRQLNYATTFVAPACSTVGGARVLLRLQASPVTSGAHGFSRSLWVRSHAPFWASRDSACQRNSPEQVRRMLQVTDRWFLTRSWSTRSSDADALIVQHLHPRWALPSVRVLDGGTPIQPRSTNGFVAMYPAVSGANLTIEMTLTHTAAGPPPAGVRVACDDCMPQSGDSSGVQIATVGAAMATAGMPVVARQPGWTPVVTVVSRSALRERLLAHIQNVLFDCPVALALASEATHLCETPIIRFLPDGVQVEVAMRPVRWGGGDTVWTKHRLVYPLRPINGDVVFREPSRTEASTPLQTAGSGLLERLIVANPLTLQPLTWELASRHARRYGNACLIPDLTRAVFGSLRSRAADVLEIRLHAPVDAVSIEACRLPFPIEHPGERRS